MRRTRSKLAAVALAALLASACGDDQNGGAVTEPGSTTGSSNGSTGETGSPPLSSTPLPTLRPASKPPTTPSDPQPTGWIAGRVTRGGSGPCYGLETDDGRQYAMYNADGITLEKGAVVRVRVEPLLLRIYCGPGQHVHMLKVEVVG